MNEILKNALSVEDVNAAIAKTGNRARLRHNPASLEPGFYFVDLGKRLRAHKVEGVSSVSDRTVEEWMNELKIAEVEVELDRR